MKIIWALDVFANQPKAASTAAFLRSFGTDTPNGLVPVYVAGPGETRLSLAFDIEASKRYSEFPKQKLIAALTKAKLADLASSAQVVKVGSPSMGAMADALIAFAKKEKASFIAISKHSRTAVERFLVGSFTEAMISRSPLPLLILQPQAKVPARLRRIFFSTDLSETSKRAFQSTTALGKSVGADVALFHQLEPIYPIGFDIPPPGLGDIEEMRREQVRKSLDGMAKGPLKAGLKVKTVIDGEYGDIADHALEGATREKADLVSLVKTSGPLASFVLGSVARRVVRQSELPVLLWPK